MNANISLERVIPYEVLGQTYFVHLDYSGGEYHGTISMTIGTPITIESSNHGKIFTVSYNLGSMRRAALFEMECDASELTETINTFIKEVRQYHGALPSLRRRVQTPVCYHLAA